MPTHPGTLQDLIDQFPTEEVCEEYLGQLDGKRNLNVRSVGQAKPWLWSQWPMKPLNTTTRCSGWLSQPDTQALKAQVNEFSRKSVKNWLKNIAT